MRLRSEDKTARIELPSEQLRELVATTDLPALVAALQSYGFVYVSLDLEGFRSSKLNQVVLQAATQL